MNILSTIWDWFWLFFSIFVWVAYLMALVYIIIDIFRDRSLNGGIKAVWLIFLVFVPLLTALVYLIARGRGMAERSAERRETAPEYSADYVRSVSFASPADEIAKAQALHDQGIITDGELDALKAKALGSKF